MKESALRLPPDSSEQESHAGSDLGGEDYSVDASSLPDSDGFPLISRIEVKITAPWEGVKLRAWTNLQHLSRKTDYSVRRACIGSIDAAF